MTSLLLAVFLLLAGIQLLYILFIFSRTAFYQDPVSLPDEPSVAASTPGVSIIVCAWNELANLQELIPLLDAQQYPAFEIIVMNDRSGDGTRDWLEEVAGQFPRLRFFHIDREHEHVTPKKYALTIGIRKAVYDTVLLTDADCRPASDRWLAGMAAHLADPVKEIVLGFSPYERRRGWLNRIIRYETLYTAVQYFSLSLTGNPYMGVGRNLMYRRDLFLANRGFYSHMRVLGGDDDLFLNEVATSRNVAVSLYPETFTESKPKETWETWRRQKRRHLSVGRYYRTRNKAWLGLLSLSHVLTWVLTPAIVGLALPGLLRTGWPAMLYERETGLWLIGLGAILLRLLAFWLVVGRISWRLGRTVHWVGIPVMDVVLAGFFAGAGLKTLFSRRKNKLMWR